MDILLAHHMFGNRAQWQEGTTPKAEHRMGLMFRSGFLIRTQTLAVSVYLTELMEDPERKVEVSITFLTLCA